MLCYECKSKHEEQGAASRTNSRERAVEISRDRGVAHKAMRQMVLLSLTNCSSS